MRLIPHIVVAAWLVLCAGVRAQEQERGFKERVLGEADRTLEFKGWDRKYYSGAGKVEARSASAKKFRYTQKVRSKKIGAREYRAGKGAWGGDFLFETGAAKTEGAYHTSKINSEYANRKLKSDTAKESEKSAETSSSPDAEREYLGREAARIKSSGKGDQPISSGWQGKLRVLSIDDVRELLNKSK
jgi:hypothetical protein